METFPIHPVPITNMAQRVEGRNAVVDHDHHRVPDTLASMSHLNSGMSFNLGEHKITSVTNYVSEEHALI